VKEAREPMFGGSSSWFGSMTALVAVSVWLILLNYQYTSSYDLEISQYIVGVPSDRTAIVTMVGGNDCPYASAAEVTLQYLKIHMQENIVISTWLTDKLTYLEWLSKRKLEKQIPDKFTTSPAIFFLHNNQRTFIPGTNALVDYLKLKYPSFELPSEVTRTLQTLNMKKLPLASNSNLKASQPSNSNLKSFQASDSNLKASQAPNSNVKSPPALNSNLKASPALNSNVKPPPTQTPTQRTTILSTYSIRRRLPPLLAYASMKLTKIVTEYRSNAEKSVTNYGPFRLRLMERGWKHIGRAPKLASMILVQDQASASKIIRSYPGSMVNNIGWGGQSCFGGTKNAQINCRSKLALSHGCDYRALGIQPPQYRLFSVDECNEFFQSACKSDPNRLWIKKPSGGQHGKGMTVHQGCKDLKSSFEKCTESNARFFMMPYLNPALLGGHKFDVRSYLLVARTSPLIAFYHDGFARKASSVYSTDLTDKNAHITNAESQQGEDHFYDFPTLQKVLTSESGFPQDYMKRVFRAHAFKVENFVLQASRKDIRGIPGTFQLFALDWIIDAWGGIHMLECNSNPLVRDYAPMKDTFVETWDGMMDIVVGLQTEPHLFAEELVTSPERFSWRDWFLVFNEDEEIVEKTPYNACNINLANPQFRKPEMTDVSVPIDFEEETPELKDDDTIPSDSIDVLGSDEAPRLPLELVQVESISDESEESISEESISDESTSEESISAESDKEEFHEEELDLVQL